MSLKEFKVINKLSTLILVFFLFYFILLPFSAFAQIYTVENDDKIILDNQEMNLNITDDTKYEDLIIKTNKSQISNLFGNFSFYFTITNNSPADQDIQINLYNTDPKSTISRFTTNENKSWSITSATSTRADFPYILTTWNNLYKSDLNLKGNIKEFLGSSFKDYITAGEVVYYKANLFKLDNTEFFIEAIGAKGAYGKLDPWTYTQNFDSLNDGNLNGQDNWICSPTTKGQVEATTTLTGTKSLALSGVVSYCKQTVSATAGTLFYKIKWATAPASGDGGGVMVADKTSGTKYIGLVKEITGNQVQYFILGSYVNWFIADPAKTYVIEIEFDYTNQPDKVKYYYKEVGGSWNNTGWVNSGSSGWTNATSLELYSDSGESYYDDFQPTDPDQAQATCGDASCNGDETCETCSQDCGECESTSTPVNASCIPDNLNNLAFITACSYASSTGITYTNYHIPFFVWIVFTVIFLFIMNRLIIEWLIRWRK